MPLSAWFVRFAGPRLPLTGLVTFTVGTFLIRYIRTSTYPGAAGRLGASATGIAAREHDSAQFGS
jgi:hypothetical protein